MYVEIVNACDSSLPSLRQAQESFEMVVEAHHELFSLLGSLHPSFRLFPGVPLRFTIQTSKGSHDPLRRYGQSMAAWDEKVFTAMAYKDHGATAGQGRSTRKSTMQRCSSTVRTISRIR